jgi:cytidylate kinase
LIEKGADVTLEGVLEDIKKRDLQDTTRAFAPLVIPDGAVVIDTSFMSIPEVKSKIKEYIC